jgi:hypothetical protein
MGTRIAPVILPAAAPVFVHVPPAGAVGQVADHTFSLLDVQGGFDGARVSEDPSIVCGAPIGGAHRSPLTRGSPSLTGPRTFTGPEYTKGDPALSGHVVLEALVDWMRQRPPGQRSSRGRSPARSAVPEAPGHPARSAARDLRDFPVPWVDSIQEHRLWQAPGDPLREYSGGYVVLAPPEERGAAHPGRWA